MNHIQCPELKVYKIHVSACKIEFSGGGGGAFVLLFTLLPFVPLFVVHFIH